LGREHYRKKSGSIFSITKSRTFGSLSSAHRGAILVPTRSRSPRAGAGAHATAALANAYGYGDLFACKKYGDGYSALEIGARLMDPTLNEKELILSPEMFAALQIT
jgi:hypothetical protein